MTDPSLDIMLSQLSDFVASQTGLHFPQKRWNDLEHKMQSAAHDLGFKDMDSCVAWLLSSTLTKKQIEILASHLTVGETYFFRETKSFEILETHILHDLIQSRSRSTKHLRIWSAGCSTGEEAYSIAILLSKLIPDLKDWNITILATDINPNSIKKALNGVYGEWSFRNTPSWVKDGYFEKTRDGRYKIITSINKMVTFSHHNLAGDTYPSLVNNTNAMDIIFCRNVLMYFTSEFVKKVINNLHRSLVDNGWIITSPSEGSHVLFKQFEAVNFSDTLIFRKTDKTLKPFEVVLDIPRIKPKIPITPSLDPVAFKSKMILKPKVALKSKGKRSYDPKPKSNLLSTIQKEQMDANTISSTSYMEAKELYRQGRYTETVNNILGLVGDSQNNSKATILLARAYANQGKLSEALEWCEKAIDTDKLNSGLYYLHATVLQEYGSIDEAKNTLKRALYLNQDFVMAHFSLGNLAFSQHKLKESHKHFDNALALLRSYDLEDVLPASEGITAGRLSEIIVSITGMEGTT